MLEPPIQQSRPAEGEYVVRDILLEEDRIQAQIEFQPYCYNLVLDQIEHNQIYGPQKRGGSKALGGTLAGIGSGVLSQAAGETSDHVSHDNKDPYLAREQSAAEVLFGVLFLASGSELVSQSLNRPTSYRWVNVSERPERTREVCNESQLPGGTLGVYLGDKLIAKTESTDGQIDLAPSTLPGICDHLESTQQAVQIVYTPQGSTEHILLAENYKISGCDAR